MYVISALLFLKLSSTCQLLSLNLASFPIPRPTTAFPAAVVYTPTTPPATPPLVWTAPGIFSQDQDHLTSRPSMDN